MIYQDNKTQMSPKGGIRRKRESHSKSWAFSGLEKSLVGPSFKEQKSSWAICLLETSWLSHSIQPLTGTICLRLQFFLFSLENHLSPSGWLMAWLYHSVSPLPAFSKGQWAMCLFHLPSLRRNIWHLDLTTADTYASVSLRCIFTACLTCRIYTQTFPIRKIQLIPYVELTNGPKLWEFNKQSLASLQVLHNQACENSQKASRTTP